MRETTVNSEDLSLSQLFNLLDSGRDIRYSLEKITPYKIVKVAPKKQSYTIDKNSSHTKLRIRTTGYP